MTGTSYAATHAVDIVVGVALLVFAIRGYARGLFHEVMRLVALVVAMTVAFRWTPAVLPELAASIPGPSFIDTPIVFALLFAVTGIVLRILISIAGRSVVSGWRANRVGGALFGMTKGAVVLGSTMLMLRTFTPAPLPEGARNPFAEPVQKLNVRIAQSPFAARIAELTSSLFSSVVDAPEIRLRMLAASDNERP